MSLPVPSVSLDPGPDYASNVNGSLTLIDGHDHSAGKGVPITPSGLNINSDLTLNGNNLIGARSLRLLPQSATLSLATDLGCLYEVGVDLYYNDGSGNQIRITQSGSIAGTSGSIANLVSPASASYISGNSTFVFQSAANTPANLDGASILLRNLVANSKSLTLSPPSAMASNYTITLPSLPGSTSFMTMDVSGNIGTSISTNQGITTSNIADASITNAKLALLSVDTGNLIDSSVTTAKIADGNVTPVKRSALGQQISASSGNATTTNGTNSDIANLSVTITTTGRPVFIGFISDASGTGTSELDAQRTPGAGVSYTNYGVITLFRGATMVGFYRYGSQGVNAAGTSITFISVAPCSSIQVIDTPSAGTYTYKAQYRTNGADIIGVSYTKLIAYEL